MRTWCDQYRFPAATGVQIVNNLTDTRIVQRDGASVTVIGNYTQATSSMFAEAANGDLHLTGSAANAIDRGVEFVVVPTGLGRTGALSWRS